jgi:hypothetical protein
MHLNGDMQMNLPFFLLKSLTKMEKKVQSNPRTDDKSLFHQGLIKRLVLYALSEVRVSWRQLLTFLGFDEQGSNIQKKPLTRNLGFQQRRMIPRRVL